MTSPMTIGGLLSCDDALIASPTSPATDRWKWKATCYIRSDADAIGGRLWLRLQASLPSLQTIINGGSTLLEPDTATLGLRYGSTCRRLCPRSMSPPSSIQLVPSLCHHRSSIILLGEQLERLGYDSGIELPYVECTEPLRIRERVLAQEVDADHVLRVRPDLGRVRFT